MAWLYLMIAAIFEVTFATSMKAAEGFTRLWPSVITAIAVVGGIFFLTLALRHLPVSIGYPIWVGLGAIGTVLLGLVLFDEPITLMKGLSVAAIVAGVIGLKIASPV